MQMPSLHRIAFAALGVAVLGILASSSMGKDSTPTNNGSYIVGDRYRNLIMDSSTYGLPVNSPNGYRLDE